MTPINGLEAGTPRARWEHRISSTDGKLTMHRSKDGPKRVRIEARPEVRSESKERMIDGKKTLDWTARLIEPSFSRRDVRWRGQSGLYQGERRFVVGNV